MRQQLGDVGLTGNSENDGGDKDVTFLDSVNLLRVVRPGCVQERSESEWSDIYIIPFSRSLSTIYYVHVSSGCQSNSC